MEIMEMANSSHRYLDERFAAIDQALARLEVECEQIKNESIRQERLQATELACHTGLNNVQFRLAGLFGPLSQDAELQCNLVYI